jgi:hypothetical protein
LKVKPPGCSTSDQVFYRCDSLVGGLFVAALGGAIQYMHESTLASPAVRNLDMDGLRRFLMSLVMPSLLVKYRSIIDLFVG